jgi:hypothetical protein
VGLAVTLALVAPAGADSPRPHPRLLLDRVTLERVRSHHKLQTAAWRRLTAICERDAARTLDAGYEGFDWAQAVANLGLCWQATGDARYGRAAVGYVAALADDRFRIGDGKGGDRVVRHDDGYPIRSFGTFAALGYDWLHDAPGMTPALRARLVERLRSWIAWYGQSGYQRDHPIANYFCGYLAATSFAALAVDGEAPEAAGWLELAEKRLFGELIIPSFAAELAGGDWPEGWQYGELSATEVALTAAAFASARSVPLLRRLPWLGEIVAHHMHALVPGSSAVYDNGDWSDHPARPLAQALSSVAFALDAVDATRAAEARWLVRHGLPPLEDNFAWLTLLADWPGAPERDPHQGAPLSLELAGTGLSFFRSAWRTDAVWASFQAGPTIADHQHNDQGHFELWRGGDALIVDGGDYNSAATINHNSLLVDDGGRLLVYSPNQGRWGSARTTRFFDDGEVGVVSGDLAGAYLPHCVEDGCKERVVDALERTLLFVRPSTLVIEDRVTLSAAAPLPSVRWVAHVAAQPQLGEGSATAVVGGSRVSVLTLEPAHVHPRALREPTAPDAGPYRRNQPWGPMWRIEVAGARAERDQRFLHVVTASAAAEQPARAQALWGAGLSGALLGDGHAAEAVLFADDVRGGDLRLPTHDAALVLARLSPRARYQLGARATGDGCQITVRWMAEAGADGRMASTGGSLRATLRACRWL